MATRRNPRFKECRRLGLNVCGHPKAMKRASTGRRRGKPSEYNLQLLEKQKVKAYYGILEKQMRKYYEKAFVKPGLTANNMFVFLESRLDNLTYRAGFGASIRQARQLVSHGHVLVNGKRVDIPSYQVQAGDTFSLKEKTRKNELVRQNFEERQGFAVPYLEKDDPNFSATYTRLPLREEIPVEINDQLVVEFYSR